MFYYGSYESQLVKVFNQVLKPGATCIRRKPFPSPSHLDLAILSNTVHAGLFSRHFWEEEVATALEPLERSSGAYDPEPAETYPSGV